MWTLEQEIQKTEIYLKELQAENTDVLELTAEKQLAIRLHLALCRKYHVKSLEEYEGLEAQDRRAICLWYLEIDFLGLHNWKALQHETYLGLSMELRNIKGFSNISEECLSNIFKTLGNKNL